ncbi:2-succinyl-5-enolpyruvyl-6-hydroxy-3-cyclohexene-1-carboxylic-acid synthase [Fodinisporobacter ferrooxydans]|uniref:2-succinyl-5-enolpyruvyl-6-hydroxy-3-cyclohexene-1-carboxylate synthase n=1 Tax=Fodinisporobacter ferrooxydans TaxID=2901836 RepID=A0ABY4CQX4_9BACL|nr:2-succinyl-5-enolpyruvyl-6-hydroxy-3-cyclohexene-1-carboxylic-acid synthase [Alicyclobacillaceae bacterium MYW30-H2]
MTGNEAVSAYVAAFVDELVQSGVTNAVISPGSRSTPLSMAMAEHSNMRIWMHVDERSAGFFALGMAKAKRTAVVLVCSSGTAAANYYPAVVEAYQGRTPLIVCTADRPHELRDVGAPQAIQQIELYGSYVKWFVEMALPERTPEMLHYVRTAAARAAAVAKSGPQGPVHLNFPFREPLVPDFSSDTIWESGKRSMEPHTSYARALHGKRSLPSEQLDRLAGDLAATERGVIVCGPLDQPGFAEAVTRLAETLQFPIFADPLSQVRFGKHASDWVIDTYDTFLRDVETVRQFEPEIVLRFGAMPVSKAFLQYLKRFPNCRQMIVQEDEGWLEPTLLASDMIYTDPEHFCNEISMRCKTLRSRSVGVSHWSDQIFRVHAITRQVLIDELKLEHWHEGKILSELTRQLPEHGILYVGNSMPIRDLDTFGLFQDREIRVLANRGANGIDGVVSSALGASTCGQPLVLAIGDLSFFHDLNGLLAAKLHQLNATIVLVNNDGGGIFSFLPQAQSPAHFETLFGTPIGLNYRHVVEMYGGQFVSVQSFEQYRSELALSLSGTGLRVIEIKTDRGENVAQHRNVWQNASQALQSLRNEVPLP